jgi:hypothetical protein
MTVSQLNKSQYHRYFDRYIGLLNDIPLIETLGTGMLETSEFFESLPESKLKYRYAEGKWTPLEVLQHLIDTERIFCYRALYAARTENVELRGFDHDLFVTNGNANDFGIADLVQEYVSVRTSSIYLFKNLPEASLQRVGIANGNPFTVAALAFVIAGHEKHHRTVIKDLYLS